MDDAAGVAARVGSGRSRAVDVTMAALERAEAATVLNAFTLLDPARSLERARAVDEIVAAGSDPGPLAGVPVALKDIVDQAGVPTTAGSSFLNRPAAADAPVVRRLQAAGAVIIGRTGLHEFAYGFSSENDWWGPVRNPWDPATSPGGSSGGSAAAVAAGIAPVGIGTDTGGSVRVPAALCGLVGLKVTHGRIPLTGVFPLAPSLDTVGPITRRVADTAIAYLVLAGHHPADPWSVDEPVTEPTAERLDRLTIGIPHPWVDRPLAPAQAAGLAAAIDLLESAGAAVRHLELPSIDQRDVPDAAYHEVAEIHRLWFAADPSRYGPSIRERLATVFDLSDEDIASGAAWRSSLVRAFGDAFGRCDVLLTPSTAARAKPIGQELLDVGAGPEPYRPVLSWFTPLVNQAGCPAITLPLEVPSVAGLPPSIQLIGPRWSEARLLGIGLELERLGHVAGRLPPGSPLSTDRHTMIRVSQIGGRLPCCSTVIEPRSRRPTPHPPCKE